MPPPAVEAAARSCLKERGRGMSPSSVKARAVFTSARTASLKAGSALLPWLAGIPRPPPLGVALAMRRCVSPAAHATTRSGTVVRRRRNPKSLIRTPRLTWRIFRGPIGKPGCSGTSRRRHGTGLIRRRGSFGDMDGANSLWRQLTHRSAPLLATRAAVERKANKRRANREV